MVLISLFFTLIIPYIDTNNSSFMKFLYAFVIQIFVFTNVFSQLPNTFNFDINNGLPSNHIYCIMTDRYGYLWIATDRGVAKYNGYEFRVFDLSDGLPNNDVWDLFEDRKGRIWLSNISEDIGYMKNNTYHKAFIKNSKGTIFPSRFHNVGDNITFNTSAVLNGVVWIEHNDTIVKHTIGDKRDTDIIHNGYLETDRLHNVTALNDSGESIMLTQNEGYAYWIKVRKGKVTATRMLFSNDTAIKKVHGLYFNVGVKNMIVSYRPKGDPFIHISDISTHKTSITDLTNYGGSVLHHVYPDGIDNYLYAICDKNILQFDYRMRKINSYSIEDLTLKRNIDGDKIRFIHDDKFWGLYVGSTNNGIWINTRIKNNFVLHEISKLTNYVYLGGITDSVCFWWNRATGILAQVKKNELKFFPALSTYPRLRHITHYNQDTFFISGTPSYFLDIKKGVFVVSNTAFAATADMEQNIFMITPFGFSKCSFKDGSFTNPHMLNANRYSALTYDPLRNQYWAYNTDNVFIHDARTNKDTLLSGEKLHNFGVKKADKIVVEGKYGNVFIKGNDNMNMFDCEANSYKELFGNYNLNEASLCVYNSTLIILGRFGILYSKILGRQKVSEPLLHKNIKDLNYRIIYDYQVSWGKIRLRTDKGDYEVIIPDDSAILNSKHEEVEYKFVILQKDTMYNAVSGDTVIIDQNSLSLQFDVINPLGNGKVTYKYKLPEDTVWQFINANELVLPSSLKPDNYYTLSLVINDNVWRSNIINLNIYIRPYWWQTRFYSRIIWLSAILLILVLFTLSVVVTRRLVINANKKRNLRMELELKAIYAQINPHFIFNSLNSALLLVNKNKMVEAHAHISKFSRLLRGYIKSSRNKLITIAEEITNLKDYIELQQTRFKNKFEYTIAVNDQLDPDHILIPALLVQPFVENAINHGILPKVEKSHLSIEFNTGKGSNEIICTIEDDGIGRIAANKIRENKDASYGDLLIKDLVSIFNKYENMNIEISYIDKQVPLTGTIVTILIKKPHHA